MVSEEKNRPLRAKLFMADGVFNRVVLRILISEFDKGQEQTSLGIKVSSCASAMSVVITGAEI